MACPTIATHRSRTPAQSTCTWAYHKINFRREFAGAQNPENIRTQLTLQKMVASARMQFHCSL